MYTFGASRGGVRYTRGGNFQVSATTPSAEHAQVADPSGDAAVNAESCARSGFGSRIWFRVSVFGVRDSYFMFRVSDSGFRVRSLRNQGDLAALHGFQSSVVLSQRGAVSLVATVERTWHTQDSQGRITALRSPPCR